MLPLSHVSIFRQITNPNPIPALSPIALHCRQAASVRADREREDEVGEIQRHLGSRRNFPNVNGRSSAAGYEVISVGAQGDALLPPRQQDPQAAAAVGRGPHRDLRGVALSGGTVKWILFTREDVIELSEFAAHRTLLDLAMHGGDQALVLLVRVINLNAAHFRDDGVGTNDEHEGVRLINGGTDPGKPFVGRWNSFPVHP
ncbi:MAG TPA: hypothetical protein VGA56_05435 [Opitutaceae bacterium]